MGSRSCTGGCLIREILAYELLWGSLVPHLPELICCQLTKQYNLLFFFSFLLQILLIRLIGFYLVRGYDKLYMAYL